jgi:hypothetical protein
MVRTAMPSEVFVIVVARLKGADEGICAVCAGGEGVEPPHYPGAEGWRAIDLVFRVVFFAWSGFVSCEAVWCIVLVNRHVD